MKRHKSHCVRHYVEAEHSGLWYQYQSSQVPVCLSCSSYAYTTDLMVDAVYSLIAKEHEEMMKKLTSLTGAVTWRELNPGSKKSVLNHRDPYRPSWLCADV